MHSLQYPLFCVIYDLCNRHLVSCVISSSCVIYVLCNRHLVPCVISIYCVYLNVFNFRMFLCKSKILHRSFFYMSTTIFHYYGSLPEKRVQTLHPNGKFKCCHIDVVQCEDFGCFSNMFVHFK